MENECLNPIGMFAWIQCNLLALSWLANAIQILTLIGLVRWFRDKLRVRRMSAEKWELHSRNLQAALDALRQETESLTSKIPSGWLSQADKERAEGNIDLADSIVRTQLSQAQADIARSYLLLAYAAIESHSEPDYTLALKAAENSCSIAAAMCPGEPEAIWLLEEVRSSIQHRGSREAGIASSESQTGAAEPLASNRLELAVLSVQHLLDILKQEMLLGHFRIAERLGRKAVSVAQKSRSAVPEAHAVAHAQLLQVLSILGKHQEVLPEIEQVSASVERYFGVNCSLAIGLRLTNATCLDEVGRGDEALRSLEALLPHARQGLGEEHPQSLSVAYYLAMAMHSKGRCEESLRLADWLLPRHVKVKGKLHIDTVATSLLRAQVLGDLLRIEEADRQFRDIVEACPLTEAVTTFHPQAINAHHRYGTFLLKNGRAREASRILQMVCNAEAKFTHRRLELRDLAIAEYLLACALNRKSAEVIDKLRRHDEACCATYGEKSQLAQQVHARLRTAEDFMSARTEAGDA